MAPQNPDVLFVPKQSVTARRLSKFEGPNDIDYRSLVNAVKRSLIVKCSITKSGKLATGLSYFIGNKFPVDLQDQLSQTALHLAIKTPNLDAVKRLLFQGKASVMKRDSEGRSPLNIAVQEAAYQTWGLFDYDLEKTYAEIINVLMKKGARIDDKDNDGKTPWSYAEGEANQWIGRLKDKHLVIGSSWTTSGRMETVRPPQPGPQQEACDAFDTILAEVFLNKKRGRLSEVFNFNLASVYDIIYNGISGVARALAVSRPAQLPPDKLRCRWIHLPSNNEQWVHDLMVSLGIQYASMGGQRHEGSRLIDRYMMPQAKRYKQSSNSSRPKSDDIVIFVSGATLFSSGAARCTLRPNNQQMPILGFETHRHRKYLTRTLHKTENKIRITRARSASSDQTAESSSDDEDPGPGQESSQLYPRTGEKATSRETQVLSGYLDSKTVEPVHCRRTLDQFSYYMLNSTEERDKSQVAYRWAKNQCEYTIKPKNRPIVMVDQLWLWAFHDGTVITSFPNTWNGQEEYNLSNVLVKELRYNKDRPIIKSAEDLLHLILKTSIDFFERKGPAGFQFHEGFRSSISNISEKQSQLFYLFRHATKRLHARKLGSAQRKEEMEFLFNLEEETGLLIEIVDIQDELTIVKTVLKQQLDVVEELSRLYPNKVDEEADEASTARTHSLEKDELLILQNLVQLLRDQTRNDAATVEAVAKDNFPNDGDASVPPGDSSNVMNDDGLPYYPRGSEAQGQKKPGGGAKKKKAEPWPTTVSMAPVKSILQNRDVMYETMALIENNIRIVTDMLAYAKKVESSVRITAPMSRYRT
jgi:hypothetical protein